MPQEWDASGKPIAVVAATGGATQWDSQGNPISAPTMIPPSTPAEGFLHSLGSSLGITGQPDPVTELKEHPVVTALRALGGPAGALAEGAVRGGIRSGGELIDAVKDAVAGNTSSASVHAINAIPIVGPGMTKATDQYANKDYMGEAGTLLGTAAQAAPAILGATDVTLADRPLVGQIPSRARAGAAFSDLNQQLANHPVNMNAAAPSLQRAAEVGVRGSTLPKSVSDLLTRSQAIEPMTFPEARDYQGALSDLSTADKMAMNGRMRGAVAQLNKNLFTDIYDAADTAGLGPKYAQAMKEYRQASQLNTAAKTVGKVAIGAAGAGEGYRLLKNILGGK